MKIKGFTSIELMLTIAIIAIIASFSLPVSISFMNKNNLDIAANSFSQDMHQAQTYAKAMKNDSQWGVKVNTGEVVLFKGSTYTGRDTAYDEIISISSSIIPGGTTEYVFNKFTGDLPSGYSMTLTSVDNDIKTIDVNRKGMVQF